MSTGLRLASGPLGVALGYAWIRGLVPPHLFLSLLALALIGAFLAVCDGLCRTRRSRFLYLFLCAAAGVLAWDRTASVWLARRELERSEPQVRGGIVLQTTGYTCVPSSAATCLKALGIEAAEAELAREAYTSTTGTTFGRMGWVIGRRLKGSGWKYRHAGRARWEDLTAPALLDVDHGGIRHAVAFLGFAPDGRARIGDPLSGEYAEARASLEARWSGEAVFFERR